MKRRHPEQDLQRTVAAWLDIQQRLGRLLYYAIPMGGARSKTEAAIFKGLGVKAGVPDIALVFPGGRAAFIELKLAARNFLRHSVYLSSMQQNSAPIRKSAGHWMM